MRPYKNYPHLRLSAFWNAKATKKNEDTKKVCVICGFLSVKIGVHRRIKSGEAAPRPYTPICVICAICGLVVLSGRHLVVESFRTRHLRLHLTPREVPCTMYTPYTIHLLPRRL